MYRDEILTKPPNVEENDLNEYLPLLGTPNTLPYYGNSYTLEHLNQIPSEDLIQVCDEDALSLNELRVLEQEETKHEVLSSLAKECCSVPKLGQHDVLPDLTEHDNGNVKLELNLASQEKNRTTWLYCKDRNKVYTKADEILNVDVLYQPRSDTERYHLRVMMVFNTKISEPVIRCQNHSSQDSSRENNIKHSILRCENPNVIYMGTVEGKNINDRLSIQIPLGCITPNEVNLVKQTVALKFVCQNSCVKRLETSLIFYLESNSGEILSKKVVAVKVCSCPKRDEKKDKFKAPFTPMKRSAADICPRGKKVSRFEEEFPVKLEDYNALPNELHPPTTDSLDLIDTAGGVELFLKLPDLDSALHVVECAINKVCAKLTMNRDNPDLNALRKIRDELIRGQKHK